MVHLFWLWFTTLSKSRSPKVYQKARLYISNRACDHGRVFQMHRFSIFCNPEGVVCWWFWCDMSFTTSRHLLDCPVSPSPRGWETPFLLLPTSILLYLFPLFPSHIYQPWIFQLHATYSYFYPLVSLSASPCSLPFDPLLTCLYVSDPMQLGEE